MHTTPLVNTFCDPQICCGTNLALFQFPFASDWFYKFYGYLLTLPYPISSLIPIIWCIFPMLTQCFFWHLWIRNRPNFVKFDPHGSYCAANYQLIPLELALQWCLYEPNSSNTNSGVVFFPILRLLKFPKNTVLTLLT